MSVHPDIPFFVPVPPPSWDVPELATSAVRSPHGMSVQPDIPIFFCDAASLVGWWLFSFLCMLAVLAAHTPYRVFVQSDVPFPLLSRPPSSAKATRKLFPFLSFTAYLTLAGEMTGFDS